MRTTIGLASFFGAVWLMTACGGLITVDETLVLGDGGAVRAPEGDADGGAPSDAGTRNDEASAAVGAIDDDASAPPATSSWPDDDAGVTGCGFAFGGAIQASYLGDADGAYLCAPIYQPEGYTFTCWATVDGTTIGVQGEGLSASNLYVWAGDTQLGEAVAAANVDVEETGNEDGVLLRFATFAPIPFRDLSSNAGSDDAGVSVTGFVYATSVQPCPQPR